MGTTTPDVRSQEKWRNMRWLTTDEARGMLVDGDVITCGAINNFAAMVPVEIPRSKLLGLLDLFRLRLFLDGKSIIMGEDGPGVLFLPTKPHLPNAMDNVERFDTPEALLDRARELQRKGYLVMQVSDDEDTERWVGYDAFLSLPGIKDGQTIGLRLEEGVTVDESFDPTVLYLPD